MQCRCVLSGSVREGGGRREEGVQCTEIAHPANIWEGGQEGGETTDWLAGWLASGTIKILSHQSSEL